MIVVWVVLAIIVAVVLVWFGFVGGQLHEQRERRKTEERWKRIQEDRERGERDAEHV